MGHLAAPISDSKVHVEHAYVLGTANVLGVVAELAVPPRCSGPVPGFAYSQAWHLSSALGLCKVQFAQAHTFGGRTGVAAGVG